MSARRGLAMDERAIWEMQLEFRSQALALLLALLVFSGVIMGTFCPELGGFSWDGVVGMLLVACAGLLLLLRHLSHALTAWALQLASLIVVFGLYERTPQLLWPALPLLVVLGGGAVMGWFGALVTALLGSLLAVTCRLWAWPSAIPPELSTAVPATSLAATLLMGLTVWPQRTLTTWIWKAYEQARGSLELARDRQVELRQALEDVSLARKELLRLTDLLAAAREAVEEARLAKEEFVANVSHELRTPLNMVVGLSNEILVRPGLYDCRLPDQLLEDVAIIKRNSEHLASLVDDVLDLVEADTGFMRLSRERVSMEGIIRQAVTNIAPFFERKGLYLHASILEDLPAISCDPLRIRQVLLNVLSNSARFTEKGGAEVRAEQQEEAIVVSVSDSGPGIDRTVVSRLFEPFLQADPSLRRRYGGTGLGLAISKRFVELHGGRIWLESAVGVGTTVSFALPISEPATNATAGPRRWFSPYHDFSYRLRNRPSLVTEDDVRPGILVVESGSALSDILKHYVDDWDIRTLPDLDEACREVERSGPRAIIVNDTALADRSGSARRVPAMVMDIPVVYCWVPDRATLNAQMGLADYLTKPVRRPELLAALQRAAPDAHRVLVVDDDDEVRQLYCRMLSSAGEYQIAQATNGTEALDAMRDWHPDAVLLDLLMPDHDGFYVLDVRARDTVLSRIPTIVISAKDQRRDPITSSCLLLTRQEGLSAQDLALAVEALVAALPPRFGPKRYQPVLSAARQVVGMT